MSNISFDKPWMLLIFIPLCLLILIPFLIAIKRDNLTKKNIISLIIHFVIIIFVTLSLAKIKFDVVVTKTEIYALCDVSYSCNDNTYEIDKAVSNLKNEKPRNSSLGVVAFAKNQIVITKPGDKIKSVKNCNIDKDETDIKSALLYTADLFSDNVIKRIVLITDGKKTNNDSILSVIETLESKDIYVDAIYVDSNLRDDDNEIQISEVSYDKNSFLNKEAEAKVLIQSTFNTNTVLNIYKNNEKYKTIVLKVNKGYNTYNFSLDTTTSGTYDYKIEIPNNIDNSNYNNSYTIEQKVIEKASMLFISENKNDEILAEKLYGNNYSIEFYINKSNVPYQLDDLCKYDQFVLSNVNITNLTNSTAFISNIDLLVSKYGKSLITLGNVYCQNSHEDLDLGVLSNMLPLHYGNDDKDSKIVAIVLDISRSMENVSRLQMAKDTACKILDMLNDDDLVTVIGFYGEVEIMQAPTEAKNREKVKEKINAAEAYQGTFIGEAIDEAYNILKNSSCNKKEVYLISDGQDYENDIETAKTSAKNMAKRGIVLSAIQIQSSKEEAKMLMNELTALTGGNYYYAENETDLDNIVLSQIADDVTETIVEGDSYPVNIVSYKNKVIENVSKLPNIQGFYYNSLKASANSAISTIYKTSKCEYEVNLYATWSYGNGVVSSFACDFSSWWLTNWQNDEMANTFLKNILATNIPNEQITSPFIVDTLVLGSTTKITCNPSSINDASLKVIVSNCDNIENTYELAFDSTNYVGFIDTKKTGLYKLHFIYEINGITREFDNDFIISYKNEYNEFDNSNINDLYQMVSQNGKVSDDLSLTIDNSDVYVSTYSYDLVFIFMIISVLLYIVDIIIRKVRWADIKSLFGKEAK